MAREGKTYKEIQLLLQRCGCRGAAGDGQAQSGSVAAKTAGQRGGGYRRQNDDWRHPLTQPTTSHHFVLKYSEAVPCALHHQVGNGLTYGRSYQGLWDGCVSSWDKPVLEEMNASIRAVAGSRQDHGFAAAIMIRRSSAFMAASHGNGHRQDGNAHNLPIPQFQSQPQTSPSPMTATQSPWTKEPGTAAGRYRVVPP